MDRRKRGKEEADNKGSTRRLQLQTDTRREENRVEREGSFPIIQQDTLKGVLSQGSKLKLPKHRLAWKGTANFIRGYKF